MRIGSLPANPWRRGVGPYIQLNQDGIVTAMSQEAYTYSLAPRVAMLDAINEIYASGGVPKNVSIGLILTPDTEEAMAAAMMEQLAAVAAEETVPITNVNVKTVPSATAIQISVCVAGERRTAKASAGTDLVLAGAIGLAGTAAIAEEKSEELVKRFAPAFVRKGAGRRAELSVRKMMECAAQYPLSAMCALGEGGVFAGLWKLAESVRKGMDVDLKALTLHQETVEICEVYGLNPYLLHSTGAMLLVTENGAALVNELNQAEIEAVQIGTLTDSNDRRILNDGEVRFLDLPAADEMYRLF